MNNWNQNNIWSPIVEPISLSNQWEINASVNGSNLIVSISNWEEPLEPSQHQLFRVNCAVSDEANLNDVTTIYTDVQLILDGWGNSGVPFINGDGTVTIDGVLSNNNLENIPSTFSLNGIYPNPFNPITTIDFSVSDNNSLVNINIFDLKGNLVKTLFNEISEIGEHQIHWNASNFSSGIYFVVFEAGELRNIQKVTMLK